MDLQLMVFTTRFPTNSDGGHRANCIEDLIEHGLATTHQIKKFDDPWRVLVKMGGLVVVALYVLSIGLLDGFLLRLNTSLVAVSSRTSHARDGPTEWPESDRQVMTIPSFHSQVFHLLSCYIAGTRHYPSKMPLWHRGAGPRHRGKQTVGHWKVRTLSATWDIHFKRCWWISWDYGRQCLFQHPLWNQGFFSR